MKYRYNIGRGAVSAVCSAKVLNDKLQFNVLTPSLIRKLTTFPVAFSLHALAKSMKETSSFFIYNNYYTQYWNLCRIFVRFALHFMILWCKTSKFLLMFIYTPAFLSWPTWVHLCFGGKSRLIVYHGTACLYEQQINNFEKTHFS